MLNIPNILYIYIYISLYIYIYIYIYIYKERGSTSVFLLGLALFGDVISYIRCKDFSRALIFALHCASGVQTDLSSNSIESQHGLLVVQGSISIACWSSKGISTHAPSCSHPRHQHEIHQ